MVTLSPSTSTEMLIDDYEPVDDVTCIPQGYSKYLAFDGSHFTRPFACSH